jgi:hypothetical protein
MQDAIDSEHQRFFLNGYGPAVGLRMAAAAQA